MDPLLPWIFVICVAVLSEFAPSDDPTAFVISFVESTTSILVMDGVVSIRATRVEGRMVALVDCTRLPDPEIPGDVAGLPVRVRVDERMGESEPDPVRAARDFVREVVISGGRVVPVVTPDGVDFVDDRGSSASVTVSGLAPGVASGISRSCSSRHGVPCEFSGDGRFSFRQGFRG